MKEAQRKERKEGRGEGGRGGTVGEMGEERIPSNFTRNFAHGHLFVYSLLGATTEDVVDIGGWVRGISARLTLTETEANPILMYNSRRNYEI